MLTSQSKILIADDHALMRLAIRDLVSDLIPSDNILETDSTDHLTSIIESEENLDLLLLDLFMPGINVFDVIKDIVDHSPKTAIVIISASEKQSHIRKAIELGVHGYIPKSSNMQVIRQALELVLAGSRYIPSEFYNSNQTDVEINQLSEQGISYDVVVEKLTERQLEIFKLLGEGKSNKEIANEMYISVNTVKIHVSAILKNLNLANRSQAGILSQRFLEDSI